MPLPFIDTFIAQIRDKGFVKSNRFVALIQPNDYVCANYLGYGGQGLAISQRLAITCYSAAISTPTFSTHEFGITVPNRLVPYGLNSNNSSGFQLEFYCLGDFFEKEIFHKWKRGIVNQETREVDYYDNYAKGSKIDLIIVPNYINSLDQVIEFVNNGGISLYGGNLPGFTLTEIYPFMYTYNGGSVNYGPVNTPTTVKVDFMFREMVPFGTYPSPNGTIPDTTTILGEGFPAALNPSKRSNQIVTLNDARRDFEQMQKRELNFKAEKEKQARKYNQSRNIQRGVDGKLLNPKVDGLPVSTGNNNVDLTMDDDELFTIPSFSTNTNQSSPADRSLSPEDKIRNALYKGLSFAQQVQNFGGIGGFRGR